jgi:Glyoxalase-like domain
MPFELDHVFVCTNLDAPEATQLVSNGLTEGPSRVHQGQGTANRCFLFHNAYLELIWVHTQDEACSPLTERTRLFERWRGKADETCPFGICLRPTHPSGGSDLPFAAWDYLPRFAVTSSPIRIGTNSDWLAEPMLFFIESASRPDSWPRETPLNHRLGVREITRLSWTRPTDDPLTPELQAVVDAGCLSVELGSAHALEICFDREAMGQSANLRPRLPLTLRW